MSLWHVCCTKFDLCGKSCCPVFRTPGISESRLPPRFSVVALRLRDVHNTSSWHAAKVANWVWLQFFVLGFMHEATTSARIGLGVLMFDVSESIFGSFISFLFKHSEFERMGTNEASFERYHLQNLASLAFACCECAVQSVIL